MKGVSFQNGIEFKLSIDGESWSQGDTFSCTLDAIEKNPGAMTKAPIRCYLAAGMDKKVKSKTEGAFEILAEFLPESCPSKWSFKIALDSRITDTKGSLYLLYGNSPELENLGHLRLNVLPHLWIREISEILTSHFRFVTPSSFTGKKGFTDLFFKPPSSRDWASLVELELKMKITETEIHAAFLFHRSEIDALKAGTQKKSVTKTVERNWQITKLIHDFNQRLNKETAELEIQSVIDDYQTQGWAS